MGQFLSAGQGNKDQAHQYGREAIRLMDVEKDYSEAIKLLRKAQSLDKHNLLYSYEIAYAYYAQKKYNSAIGFLKKLQKKEDFNERFYRLLGICYDVSGDAKKAEKTYLQGIKAHPFGGELYTEMGGLQYRKGNTDRAVNYWEMGIRRAPMFATNYYWAAKMYFHSSEPLWGVFYAEIFMNLERNSQRTAELGKMLYDTYKAAFHLNADSTVWFSMSERARTYELLVFEEKEHIPFQVAFNEAYEKSYTKWIQKDTILKTTIGIPEITEIRKEFNKRWFKYKRYARYPNILLDWHKKLIKIDYFESYSYWLLMNGDHACFEDWLEKNSKKFKSFMVWFKESPLELNKHKKFHRLQYIEGNDPIQDF